MELFAVMRKSKGCTCGFGDIGGKAPPLRYRALRFCRATYGKIGYSWDSTILRLGIRLDHPFRAYKRSPGTFEVESLNGAPRVSPKAYDSVADQ